MSKRIKSNFEKAAFQHSTSNFIERRGQENFIFREAGITCKVHITTEG